MPDFLSAGISQIDITPKIGVELSGGAFGASTGVLHPLTARALFLQNGVERILLISADLIAFGNDLADDIRTDISAKYNVPFQGIILCATHTHSGPATVQFKNWGRIDPDYISELKCRILELAGKAVSESQRCCMGSKYVLCNGIAVNRVISDGPVDHEIGVSRISDPDGKLTAIIVNFACHPVNLHSYRGLISPDFIHFIQQRICDRLGSHIPLFYMTGAAGDINPANFKFLNVSEHQAFDTGYKIADRVIDELSSISADEQKNIKFASETIYLPLKPLADANELRRIQFEASTKVASIPDKSANNWEYCLNKTKLEWATDSLKILSEGKALSHLPLTLSAIRIGSTAILAVPGELFSIFGKQIKQSSPFQNTFISTLTNGYMCYFPSRTSFETKCYEASICPMYCSGFFYEENVGDLITNFSIKLLNNLI